MEKEEKKEMKERKGMGKESMDLEVPSVHLPSFCSHVLHTCAAREALASW